MEIQNYKDSSIHRAKKFCNMRHYKHNSRVSQYGRKICILRFNTSQEHVNEDLTLSLAWLQCLKPKCKQLPTSYAVSWHPACGVVFSKDLSRSFWNLAEVGEENTHTKSLPWGQKRFSVGEVGERVREWSPFESPRNLMNDYVIHVLRMKVNPTIVKKLDFLFLSGATKFTYLVTEIWYFWQSNTTHSYWWFLHK